MSMSNQSKHDDIRAKLKKELRERAWKFIDRDGVVDLLEQQAKGIIGEILPTSAEWTLAYLSEDPAFIFRHEPEHEPDKLFWIIRMMIIAELEQEVPTMIDEVMNETEKEGPKIIKNETVGASIKIGKGKFYDAYIRVTQTQGSEEASALISLDTEQLRDAANYMLVIADELELTE